LHLQVPDNGNSRQTLGADPTTKLRRHNLSFSPFPFLLPTNQICVQRSRRAPHGVLTGWRAATVRRRIEKLPSPSRGFIWSTDLRKRRVLGPCQLLVSSVSRLGRYIPNRSLESVGRWGLGKTIACLHSYVKKEQWVHVREDGDEGSGWKFVGHPAARRSGCACAPVPSASRVRSSALCRPLPSWSMLARVAAIGSSGWSCCYPTEPILM